MTTLPTPSELLQKAEMEDSKFDLIDYWESIVSLRQKAWSWRDIASWLTKQGLKMNHSNLYRFVNNKRAIKLATLTQSDFEAEALDLLEENQSLVEESEDFQAAIAESNCVGFDLIEFQVTSCCGTNKGYITFDATFTSKGEALNDKPSRGDTINGCLTFSIYLNDDLDCRVFDIERSF